MASIVLRDIPGIAEIEARLSEEDAGRLMRPEIEELRKDIDLLSLRLFGATASQTDYRSLPWDTRPASEDEWEAHFEFLEYEFDEEDDFWSAFEVDVTDGAGEQLLCIDVLGRQLVCALKQVHPIASLLFVEGQGKNQEQIDAEAEAWARRVLGRSDRAD